MAGGSFIGPIRCESYNGIYNEENQTEQAMLRKPYVYGGGNLSESNFPATTWKRPNSNSELTLVFLSGDQNVLAILRAGAGGPTFNTVTYGLNSDSIPHPNYPRRTTWNGNWWDFINSLFTSVGHIKVNSGLNTLNVLLWSGVQNTAVFGAGGSADVFESWESRIEYMG